MALSKSKKEQNSSPGCNWTKMFADRQTEVIRTICENIENKCENLKARLENVRITEDDKVTEVLEHIDPNSVECLFIEGTNWGGLVDEGVVNHILKFKSLKWFICTGMLHIKTGHLKELLKNCKDSLSVLVLEYYNFPIVDDFCETIKQIKNLCCLKMTQIYLPHMQITELTQFLARCGQIEEIHLDQVKCHTCNWCDVVFPLNLSQNSNLEKLTLKDMNIQLIRINTSKLVSCHFSQLHAEGTCHAIYESLKHAPELRNFSLRSLDDSLDNLVKMIPTLHRLQTFELSWTHLNEFELIFSKQMTDLHEVKFVGVSMYGSALNKLMKSLPTTHHTLKLIFDPLFTQPAEVAEKVLLGIKESPRLDINSSFVFDRGLFKNCFIMLLGTALEPCSTGINNLSELETSSTGIDNLSELETSSTGIDNLSELETSSTGIDNLSELLG